MPATLSCASKFIIQIIVCKILKSIVCRELAQRSDNCAMRRFESVFGEVVRQRRRELGLSQEDLGFRSGLHRTYISEIERGLKSPSLRAVFAIAEALNINVSTLILRAEKKLTVTTGKIEIN